MTSPRSLSKKKGAFYSFTSALKLCAAPAGVLAGMFIVVMGIYPYLVLGSYMNERLSREENLKNLREQFRFFVFPNEKIEVILILFAAAGLSVLMGILIFRFCADKRTVNVYYSLGITRNALFYSRFFAGLLCLSLALIPGVVICFLLNVAYLGLSWQLSLILFYFYCGLTLFCVICFTVTAAVFASVGTVYEGALFSVGVLGLPTVFELAVGQLLDFFMKHVGSYDIITFTGNYIYTDGFDYLTSFSAYNPILFMYQPLYRYCVGTFDSEKRVLLNNDAQWVFPDVGKVFIWLLVGIAVALIGGLVLFKRRNAENCGFLNTNKALSNIVLFEILTLVGTYFFSQARYYTIPTGVIIPALIVAFIVYIIYEILLKRNFNAIVKTLYKFPIHLAVFALICVVFALDLTGADSYVPKASDVERAAVSSIAETAWVRGTVDYMSSSGNSFLDPLYFSYEKRELPEFTEASDIETLISLHKEALEKEEGEGDVSVSKFTVRYIMKDGREVVRELSVANRELCDKLLSLFDLNAVKTARTDIILSETPSDAELDDMINSKNLQFSYAFSRVTAIAPSFTSGNELNLTEDEFGSLKKAVANDLNKITAKSYMSGSSRQIGVLRFSAEDVYSGYDEELFSGFSGLPEEETTSVYYPENNYYEDNFEYEEGEDANEKMTKVTGLFMGYSQYNWMSYNGENCYDVLVTPEMTETLALLKSIGCESCFDEEKEIKSVSFAKLGMSENIYFSDHGRIYEFFGGSVDEEMVYVPDINTVVEDFTENVITDSGRIAELRSLMRIHAYTYNTGYGCLIAYSDGTYSTMYLSEENAPAYVKDYQYTKADIVDYYF